jgi:aquaporin-4
MALNPRAWFAESIATFALVFFGTISVTGAAVIFKFDSPTSSVLLISFAHGLAIMLMVYAIGHISGAHINPAVTIPMALLRKIDGGNAAGYIAFQLIGAVLGSLAHMAFLPQGREVNFGTHAPGDAIGKSEFSALGIEIILTFFLVFVIFGVAVSKNAAPGWAGFAIGMTILLDHLVGIPLTGASMNPARSLGPALVSGAWASHWVYWVGPIVGGVIAAFLYQYIFLKKEE